MMAIAISTDDTQVAISKSLLSSKATSKKQFECQKQEFQPTDFETIAIKCEEAASRF